jgi:catechol 2,3-dioxygenase-like lactoylglutathione lyase family enzyme
MRLILSMLAATWATPLLAQGTGVVRPGEPMHVMGIQHVAMTVGDIDDTIAFYAKAVPVKLVRRYQVPGSRFPAALVSRRYRTVEIAILSFPTGNLQLMDFEPGTAAARAAHPVTDAGFNHVCFQSHSRDPAIARFKAAGLEVLSRFGKPDGVDIGGYGVRYAYGRDINGLIIENESLDAPQRSEPVWITHLANAVHDRDAMLAFYGKIVGRKAHRTIEQDGNPKLGDVAGLDNIAIRGGWINVGNMDLEIWEYVRPRTPAPAGDRKLDSIGYSQFALEVGDLAAQTRRLRADGVRLVGKPVVIGGWRSQYAYDPEGNIFALTSRASAPATESVTALK